MTSKTNQWGTLFFIAAILLSGAGAGILYGIPLKTNLNFYRLFIPLAGFVLSGAAFLVGHISYPRIQNLKVYLTGYLLGIVGIFYFGLHVFSPAFFPAAPINFIHMIYALLFLNSLIVPLLPSYAKYHITSTVTRVAAACEGSILVLARFVPAIASLAAFMGGDGAAHYPLWIGIAWVIAAGTLSALFIRNEFHLGGILAGCAFIFGIAWISEYVLSGSETVPRLFFAFALSYFVFSAIIHWFMRIEHRAAYDPLLHIYNKDYCGKVLAEQSNLNMKPPFTIAMVDIDHFKKVNDTHGHQAGDIILYSVAQLIGRQVIPEGVLCRYGGEEFAVFFPRKETKEVRVIMENVRKAIEKEKVSIGKKCLSVTISCGIACRTDLSQPVDKTLAAADKALYRAKKAGRNTIKTATISGMPPSGK